MGITLAIALAGGALTGALIRFAPFCDPLDAEHVFNDEIHWNMPDPITSPGTSLSFPSHSLGERVGVEGPADPVRLHDADLKAILNALQESMPKPDHGASAVSLM